MQYAVIDTVYAIALACRQNVPVLSFEYLRTSLV